MVEVVGERVASLADRTARRRVAADVAVHLLRPVADVRVHVDPERAVLQPLLQPRLVRRHRCDALADTDHEDHAGGRGLLAAGVEEPAHELAHVGSPHAVTAADRRRELVERPRVPRAHVVARRGHAAPRLDPGLIPGPVPGVDPLLPGGQVDLGEGMEARPERADPPGLVGPGPRLVRDERRDRDRVLCAGRRLRRELRREPQPVRGRVEHGVQRSAAGGGGERPQVVPMHETRPLRGRVARRERRHGLRGPGGTRIRRRRDRRGEHEKREHDPEPEAKHPVHHETLGETGDGLVRSVFCSRAAPGPRGRATAGSSP